MTNPESIAHSKVYVTQRILKVYPQPDDFQTKALATIPKECIILIADDDILRIYQDENKHLFRKILLPIPGWINFELEEENLKPMIVMFTTLYAYFQLNLHLSKLGIWRESRIRRTGKTNE